MKQATIKPEDYPDHDSHSLTSGQWVQTCATVPGIDRGTVALVIDARQPRSVRPIGTRARFLARVEIHRDGEFFRVSLPHSILAII